MTKPIKIKKYEHPEAVFLFMTAREQEFLDTLRDVGVYPNFTEISKKSGMPLSTAYVIYERLSNKFFNFECDLKLRGKK
jgi:hypothetical protein